MCESEEELKSKQRSKAYLPPTGQINVGDVKLETFLGRY